MSKSEDQHWKAYLRDVPTDVLLGELVRRTREERAREQARERMQRCRWRQVLKKRKAATGVEVHDDPPDVEPR